MEQRPAESAGVHLPCVSVQRVREKRVLNVFMHVCSAAAAASCFFFPTTESESERAACVAPTEREIERGGVVARVCGHNMKMEREKIFRERTKMI